MSFCLSGLKRALEGAKVHTGQRWFIPLPRIYRIITEDAVRNAYQTSYYRTTDVETIVAGVCHTQDEKLLSPPGYHQKGQDTTCRRIFAILVLIGKAEEDILKTIMDHLCDLDLPVDFGDATRRPVLCHGGKTPERLLDCFETSSWSTVDKQNFNNVQWSLLAPVLPQQAVLRPDYFRLSSKTVLPWKRPQRNRLASNPDILRISIYDGHHDFSDSEKGQPYIAAVKVVKAGQLYPNGPSDIWCTGWELHSDGNEKHIAEFRVVLEFGTDASREIHLVFGWPYGTLKDVWAMAASEAAKCFSPTAAAPQNVKEWLFDQCLGLAEAVAQIHYNAEWHDGTHDDCQINGPHEHTDDGRVNFASAASEHQAVQGIRHGVSRQHFLPYAHGEIRPENVLWYRPARDDGSDNTPSMGTLKILSVGNPALVSTSQATKEGIKADIWALGCVYLEFIAWYVKGPRRESTLRSGITQATQLRGVGGSGSLPQFRAQDNTSDGRKAFIEQDKLHTLSLLVQDVRCSPTLQAFVDFIMLCMLETDSRSMVGCQRVVNELRGLSARARQEN